MANLLRRSFLFAAGALAAVVNVPAIIRVASTVTRPIEPAREINFAILAEGTQWEVRVSGWPGAEGPWYVDVPESMRDLPPADRMTAVDRIMRRVAKNWTEGVEQQAKITNDPLRIGYG